MRTRFASCLLCAGLTASLVAPAEAATRLKELVSLEGVRDNQLIGYGLVVGLNGTGDRKQTFFSAQSLANLLQQMGVAVNPLLITVRNTAAVMVTATLPGFAQEGVHIDATASAIGDAANLQGGILLLTSLKGANVSRLQSVVRELRPDEAKVLTYLRQRAASQSRAATTRTKAA